MPNRSLHGRTGTLVVASVAALLLASPAVQAQSQPADSGAAAHPAAQPATPAAAQPGAQPGTGAAPAGAPPAMVPAGPIAETTKVDGKVDAKLQGVWLLVAAAEIAPGKFKSFPQLLKIEQTKKGLEVHLIDIQWPDDIRHTIQEGNQRTMVAWAPSPETRKMLAENWSKLPIAKEKSRGEFLYDKIDYVIASPDKYAEAFTKRTPQTEKVLEGSKFGIWIEEAYKPQDWGPDSRGIQLGGRTSVYGVKSEDKDLLKGDQSTGFLAMSSTPFPLVFPGSFVMYKLAPL